MLSEMERKMIDATWRDRERVLWITEQTNAQDTIMIHEIKWNGARQ